MFLDNSNPLLIEIWNVNSILKPSTGDYYLPGFNFFLCYLGKKRSQYNCNKIYVCGKFWWKNPVLWKFRHNFSTCPSNCKILFSLLIWQIYFKLLQKDRTFLSNLKYRSFSQTAQTISYFLFNVKLYEIYTVNLKKKWLIRKW